MTESESYNEFLEEISRIRWECNRVRAERDTALANWGHQKQEADRLRAENERLCALLKQVSVELIHLFDEAHEIRGESPFEKQLLRSIDDALCGRG